MRYLFRISTLKNVIWAAGGNALMAAVSFVASIFVIRNLGPTEFGVLQEMTAYFLIIQSFENFVNPHLFKKELLREGTDRSALICALGATISLFGFLTSLVLAVLVITGTLETEFWLLVILVFSIVFRASNGVSFYFDAQLQSAKSQISLNGGNLVASLFKVFSSFTSPIATLQAWASSVHYSVTAVIHWQQAKRDIVFKLPTSDSFRQLSRICAESRYLFLSGFVDIFKQRLPYVFLGIFAEKANTGIYSAGVKLVEPWLFVSSALTISFWPKLVQTQTNPAAHRKIVSIFYAINFYVFLPLAAISLIAGGWVIPLLLGEKYEAAIGVFQISSIALLGTAAVQAINLVEISQGNSKVILGRNLVSLLLTAIFIWPAFHYRGSEGVAFVGLVANIASLLISTAQNRTVADDLRLFLAMTLRGPKILYQEFLVRKSK